MNLMVALRGAEPAELPPGTRLLNGQYQILEPLQKGGFAMTYVARDSLERHVVIKECFPAGLCERAEGVVRAVSPAVEAQFATLKQQFVREARGMATLQHPYIVAVHQVFEENNTAYMALDYVPGTDLIAVLEDEPERLTPAFFEATLREVLKAVRHIHSKGILHRDIAPDNIRVDTADRITLIDFGAAGARSTAPSAAVASLPAVKDGYSPPEFYTSGEVHDFSSDLYSLAATFHHLITGDAPPDGHLRREAVTAGKPDPYVPLCAAEWDCGYHLLATIDQALGIEREHRPQSADQWLSALDELPKQRPAARKIQAFDPDLSATLSRLVEDVNKTLAANPPARRIEAAHKPVAEAPAAPVKKQWVDLFGDPVTDLASWMEGHDEAAPAVEAEPEPVETVLEPPPPPEPSRFPALVPAEEIEPPRPRRKSLISTLLSRCFPRSPDAVPT